MKLLEYQGKELFNHYNIIIPRSYISSTLDEAKEAAAKIGYPCILKSQLTVGGRGKAGAILKCKTPSELKGKFNELLHKDVKGELPTSILIEEIVDVKKEIYMSLFLNRSKRCYSLITSTQGGVNIEEVEGKVVVDIPIDGLSAEVAEKAADKLGLSSNTKASFIELTDKLSKLVREKEAELTEINPIAILGDGSLTALDAKVIIDDNAMFRHPELKKYERVSQLQQQAEKSGFSLVELDGNIAIIGNGAGLVMSTLDMVSDAGGSAGAFLDFGGSATSSTIYEAIKIISKIKKISAILINLFGGIVKTDLVAYALLDAYKNNLIDVPVFARISGAESEKAKEMLKGSQAKLHDTIEEAIQAVVKEANQRNSSSDSILEE